MMFFAFLIVNLAKQSLQISFEQIYIITINRLLEKGFIERLFRSLSV